MVTNMNKDIWQIEALYKQWRSNTAISDLAENLYLLCNTGDKTDNATNSAMITEAIFEESKSAFDAGFRAALKQMLDLFEKRDAHKKMM